MTNDIKIFLIEDDFLFSRIMAVLLNKAADEMMQEGIVVKFEAFYSSREARYELSQNPQIVLLDYYIMDDELEPETGMQLLKTIKNYNTDTVIIVVSGQEDPLIIQQLLAEGASYYVSKKADLNLHLYPILIDTIRNLATKRP